MAERSGFEPPVPILKLLDDTSSVRVSRRVDEPADEANEGVLIEPSFLRSAHP
jgi:hypothetical protein